MEKEALMNTLKEYKKGTNVWVLYKKELTYKKGKETIHTNVYKVSFSLARLGLDYSHIKGVVVKGGGYGEHENEYIKVFANGTEVLMAYKPSLDIMGESCYLCDNKVITKEQAMQIVNKDNLFTSHSESVVWSYNIANIVAIQRNKPTLDSAI